MGTVLKVWSGSAWVAKPVKVWNGSAWVTKTLRRWNGTAWDPAPAGGGAIALVGTVQHGTQAYPGSNNYDFTVNLGTGAGRSIGVLAVTSNPGTLGINAAFLDPAGTNFALTMVDSMIGGSAVGVFRGAIPDALTGSKILRIRNNEDYANMVAYQMHVLTGATFHGGDADADNSFPNQSTGTIASVPAGSFIGGLGITIDATAIDNLGPFPVGDTPVYVEAADQGYQYCGAHVVSTVGGSIALQMRNGVTVSNAGFAIGAIAWKP